MAPSDPSSPIKLMSYAIQAEPASKEACLYALVAKEWSVRLRRGTQHISPQGRLPVQFRWTHVTPRSGITKEGTRLYRSSKSDCQGCAFKAKCCPNTPQRKVPRDLDEDARDVARSLANTPAYERSRHRRKKIEMLFAHLKRILRLGRLRLRGPSGARDEFLLAATAQNLRKLAKLRAMPAACPVPA